MRGDKINGRERRKGTVLIYLSKTSLNDSSLQNFPARFLFLNPHHMISPSHYNIPLHHALSYRPAQIAALPNAAPLPRLSALHFLFSIPATTANKQLYSLDGKRTYKRLLIEKKSL